MYPTGMAEPIPLRWLGLAYGALAATCWGVAQAWVATLPPASPWRARSAASDVPPLVRGDTAFDKELARATRKTGVTFRYLDLEAIPIGGGDAPPEGLAGAERLLPELVEALLTYPRPFRERLIREIRLEDTLYDGERERGGYASLAEDAVHVQVTGASPVEGRHTLHHEIGHLVFDDPAFRQEAWSAISPDYTPLVMPLLRPVHPLALDPDLHAAGFLTNYGATNPHEDAAEFLAWWRIRPRVVNDLATEYPRIRAKRTILKEWAERSGLTWYDRD